MVYTVCVHEKRCIGPRGHEKRAHPTRYLFGTSPKNISKSGQNGEVCNNNWISIFILAICLFFNHQNNCRIVAIKKTALDRSILARRQ